MSFLWFWRRLQVPWLTFLLFYLLAYSPTYLYELQLASCLINAQPLPAHRPAPQTTTPRLAARGHHLTDDWSLPSAHFVDSWWPFRCSFGCVLLLNQMFWKQCTAGAALQGAHGGGHAPPVGERLPPPVGEFWYFSSGMAIGHMTLFHNIGL